MSVRRLDQRTVERIAAGEVVTRPADVVRELVENALDAGASKVTVAVEGGGIDRVRVTDDGHGMSREDAELAVERHTTSKIRDAADVDRVDTLGFRGEALPSIANVARLDLVTRAEDGDEGDDGGSVAATRVTVADGEKTVETAGRGIGTTVTVTDLFERVPARRESLSGASREFAHVSDCVSRYALAHPEVRFRLEHDGRAVLTTPGTGVRDAVLAVYDRSVASQSTPIEYEGGGDENREAENGVHVSGLAVFPAVTRAKPSHVYAAVNGRALDDRTVRNAVVAGYGELLPNGRYPVTVVHVDVAPDAVDQNVHPAKREVRFSDPERVADAVEAAVRDALSGEDLSRRGEFDLGDLPALDASSEAFGDVNVIGQFRGLYLLCESDDDLLVVDQHAAHERVNYERLRAAASDGVESVAVDPPQTVSLTATEAAVVEDDRDAIESLGFRLEPFGSGTYRVTGMPAPLARVAGPEAVTDVLDVFFAGESPDDPRDALLADLACHPSFKAGDRLTDEQAEDLLADLGACEQPYACPHGRPTVVTIDEATLARNFDRPNTRFG